MDVLVDEYLLTLRAPVDGIALSEGFPVNGFRLMIALAACSVIAPLIHLAPSENARTLLACVYFVPRVLVCMESCVVTPLAHLYVCAGHVFNVVVGTFAGVFVFDYAVLHTIVTALVVYLLMLIAPRYACHYDICALCAVCIDVNCVYVAYVYSKIVGRLVLLLLLAYLVAWYVANYGTQVHCPLQWSHLCLFLKPCSHYYREFYSPDIVWDSAQMILTLKLSSVAINYSDGIIPKEKKTPAMVKNEIHEIPAILPYFGECALCAVYDHYHYQCLLRCVWD